MSDTNLLDERKLARITGKDGKLDPEKLSVLIQDYAHDCFEDEAVAARARPADAPRRGPRLPMGNDVAGGFGGMKNFRDRQTAHLATSPGVALDDAFKGFGEFAAAISPQRLKIDGLPTSLRQITNDLGSTIGADGGFLLPEQFRSEVLTFSLERSVVRPRATILPMSSLTLAIPIVDDMSHVSSVLGGVIGYWMSESATMTESQPTFGRLLLEAKKLTAYCEVPNELLQDASPALNVILERGFGRAISYYEDYGFLRGTGVGEPLGVLNSSALVAVAKETGQAAATIVWENIVAMFNRMLPESRDRAIWVAGVDTFAQLATMSLSVGTGGSAIWLQQGSGGVPVTILGRPVIFSEKLPSLGSQGDILFADFEHYVIGDRMLMTLVSSEHFKFQQDQTVFRCIERVDGRPWLQSALTPKSGGATLSPFVTLAVRA